MEPCANSLPIAWSSCKRIDRTTRRSRFWDCASVTAIVQTWSIMVAVHRNWKAWFAGEIHCCLITNWWWWNWSLRSSAAASFTFYRRLITSTMWWCRQVQYNEFKGFGRRKNSTSNYLRSWNLRLQLDLVISFLAIFLIIECEDLIFIFFIRVPNTTIEGTMKKYPI